MIIVTVLSLAFLAIMLLAPNYIAIRYGVFGGNVSTAVVAGGGVQAAASPAVATPKVVAKKAAVRRGSPKFAQRGYLWKALSPILFGFALILGIAVGGVVGYTILALALLNLVWGLIGWDGHMAGKRHY